MSREEYVQVWAGDGTQDALDLSRLIERAALADGWQFAFSIGGESERLVLRNRFGELYEVAVAKRGEAE